MRTNDPTKGTYNALARAFDHFNRRLFDGKLPHCLITYQRHQGAYGYFHGNRFADLGDAEQITDEIALNPATFAGRSPEEILSTLAHEMAHLWQHHFGKPSKNGYHNRQWAELMATIGLQPTHDGSASGKTTGPRMTHRISYDGPFEAACEQFLKNETMPLFTDRAGDDEAAAKKRASKTRYTCPGCGQNAWAKPETHLICGECEERMLTAEEMPEDESNLLINTLATSSKKNRATPAKEHAR
jgi:predicted SprT family Zn-dependent metalloprotease